jgi:hypothetical protein
LSDIGIFAIPLASIKLKPRPPEKLSFMVWSSCISIMLETPSPYIALVPFFAIKTFFAA